MRIADYRGYEIIVKREKCLGGWPLLYYTIVRNSDGWLAVDAFQDSAETVRDMVKYMKERVDNELAEADPWGEKASERRAENFA